MLINHGVGISCSKKISDSCKLNPLRKIPRYWEKSENIFEFLSEIKEKYNINTPEDWNLITQKQIRSNGGSRLLSKYSMFELKCMICPEGKFTFKKSPNPPGYWENKENVFQFLSKLSQKYNLNTPEDWNSITATNIQSNGGRSLLSKYSMYELKCLGCPEGKSIFDNSMQDTEYWENKENIDKFLSELSQKYNLNSPEDWNLVTKKHIKSIGGTKLLAKLSMYDLKCMACPDFKSKFKTPLHAPGYWENKNNIDKFLDKLKQKYNINTPEDWNLITQSHIQSNGGSRLLSKYSLYELKCLACPEGKTFFSNPRQSSGYWENNENILQFFLKLKEKYNLHTPEDWKRISKHQIIKEGGWGLFNSNNYPNIKIKFETPNETTKLIPFSKLISGSTHKRSSQRWLFLQIQKLFPQEEIVEDYFHSEISRLSGANTQFDIYMVQRNIAIEYHGKQHYEEIPSAFASLETYKQRDIEKGKLCEKYGIQLIVIPYWWDNKLDSLRTFLYSKINI